MNQYSDLKSVLKDYLSTKPIKIECLKCENETVCQEEKKFIKLGDILIFTIENHNNKKFIPDESIDLTNYVDNSLKNEKNVFELFAKSIKLGKKGDFSHQISQIKRNGKWYEIDDIYVNKKPNNYGNICGLFYKKSIN